MLSLATDLCRLREPCASSIPQYLPCHQDARRRTLLASITVDNRTINQQISSNFNQLYLAVHFMSDVVMSEGSGHRQIRGLGAGEQAVNSLGKAVLPETICRQCLKGQTP